MHVQHQRPGTPYEMKEGNGNEPGRISVVIRYLTLIFQKARMLQVQGVKGETVVSYRKPLTTQVEDPVSSGKCYIVGFPEG